MPKSSIKSEVKRNFSLDTVSAPNQSKSGIENIFSVWMLPFYHSVKVIDSIIGRCENIRCAVVGTT